MDSKVYRAILSTICYSDIFDFPLTESEVYKWRKDIRILGYNDIKRANGVIAHKGRFMFLKGRERLIAQRMRREKISGNKLAIAKRIASLLKRIPTVRLIGVSGSVAMNNASKQDDIDIFIIAQTQTVWLTRLLAIIIVELFGKRRRPGDIQVADKICLNMFMDENFLPTPKERQNLYTAHEICQLKALYDRDNTYVKFLAANMWIGKFLPNGVRIKDEGLRMKGNHLSLFVLEWFAKKLQLWYMRRHTTSEVVTDHYLSFHPNDYTDDILTAYRERLSFYGLQV